MPCRAVQECHAVTRPLRFAAPALYGVAAQIPTHCNQWLTAFTTAVPGWQNSEWGPTHLHRCTFWEERARIGAAKGIQWRVETQILTQTTSRPPLRIIEGRSRDLTIALSAGVSRAREALEGAAPASLISPAFMALPSLGGAPRIWVCSAIFDPQNGSDASLRTCLIRETRQGPHMDFACTLEGGLESSHAPVYWHANSLSAATEQCIAAIQSAAHFAYDSSADHDPGFL